MKNVNIRILTSIFALGFALSQTACGPQADGDSQTDPATGDQAGSPVRVAVAELQPTAGSETRGTVTFTETEDGVHVLADITGMSGGAGMRGFHIHENGDCSAPDGTSAGGHFNPGGAAHGAPEDEERHAGDFGNLEVDEDGRGHADFIDTHISFSGPNSIIDRAVIVHAEEDDLQTQPTGDAGPRAACGVIEIVESNEN